MDFFQRCVQAAADIVAVNGFQAERINTDSGCWRQHITEPVPGLLSCLADRVFDKLGLLVRFENNFSLIRSFLEVLCDM